jgi:hypothetical protein
MLSLQWFHPDRFPGWVQQREVQLEHMTVENHWKQYLRTSGSMIEYYQLQLAYMMMSYHEQIHHILYDYVIRARTDSIYCKPLDFHWLHWSDSEVEARIKAINCELVLSNIEVNPLNTLSYFMSTIISDSLIPNIQNILTRYIPNQLSIIPSLTNGAELNNYIKTGAYILVIRANNLYVVARESFNMIPTLSHIYGFLKSPHNDAYWYNAENQFQSACYYSGLAVFDYNTLFEDKSLYEYDEKRYFDLDLNVLNPCMLYCLVRY